MRGPALVSHSVLYRYVGAVLTAALAVGLRLALNPMLGRDVPYIVNFFAIAVAAWLFAAWFWRFGLRSYTGASA